MIELTKANEALQRRKEVFASFGAEDPDSIKRHDIKIAL